MPDNPHSVPLMRGIEGALASLRSQLSAAESARVKAEEALAAVADDSPAAERLKLFKAALDSRDSALSRATAAEARVAELEANERHDLARIDVLRRLCHEAWRYIEHDEVNPGTSRPLAERLQRAALESTDGK